MKRRDRNSYWNVACREIMALQRALQRQCDEGLGPGMLFAARANLMDAKAHYRWHSTRLSRTPSRVHWDRPLEIPADDFILR